MNEKFRVTENHIKLLRAANVRWEDCEFGAPAIDCKRPYGNSYIYGDIAEILGISSNGEDEFTKDQKVEMLNLHLDTETVLQIVLCTGEMRPGLYERERPYSNKWKLIEAAPAEEKQ